MATSFAVSVTVPNKSDYK